MTRGTLVSAKFAHTTRHGSTCKDFLQVQRLTSANKATIKKYLTEQKKGTNNLWYSQIMRLPLIIKDKQTNRKGCRIRRIEYVEG